MSRTETLWTASCCRLWPVMPYYGRMGRCGLCNEVPEIIYLHWDDEKEDD